MKNSGIAFVIFNTYTKRFWGDIQTSLWSGFLKKKGIENDILLVLLRPDNQEANVGSINQLIKHCRTKKYKSVFLRSNYSSAITEKIKKELNQEIYFLNPEGEKVLNSFLKNKIRDIRHYFYPSFKYKVFGLKNPGPPRMAAIYAFCCPYKKGLKENPYFRNIKQKEIKFWKGCSYCISAMNCGKEINQQERDRTLEQNVKYLKVHLPTLKYIQIPFPGDSLGAIKNLVKEKNFRNVNFHVQFRSDTLAGEKEKIEEILNLMKKGNNAFFSSNIGFENFSPKELLLLNRGTSDKINLRALQVFSYFKNNYPRNWITEETTASFILFNPFTTIQDIKINLSYFLKFKNYFEMFKTLNFNKLKIPQDTPIYFLAKKENLLVVKNSLENVKTSCGGYVSDFVDYKFKDPRIESLYKNYEDLLYLNNEFRGNLVGKPIDCLVKALNSL